MTERPTRAITAGRVYLDLQNLARRDHRPTDELLQIYALEGFLARLAASAHADRLVLKGGVLLAAFDTRRPRGSEQIGEAVCVGVDLGRLVQVGRCKLKKRTYNARAVIRLMAAHLVSEGL